MTRHKAPVEFLFEEFWSYLELVILRGFEVYWEVAGDLIEDILNEWFNKLGILLSKSSHDKVYQIVCNYQVSWVLFLLDSRQNCAYILSVVNLVK